MRLVDHPNVVSLYYYFYSNGEKQDEVFLNLVLEYVPETVYRASRHYAKMKLSMPMLNIKVYNVELGLYVPTDAIYCVYSFTGYLSPRHQTTKSVVGSKLGNSETM